MRVPPARASLLLFTLAALANVAFLLLVLSGIVVIGFSLAFRPPDGATLVRPWADKLASFRIIVVPALPLLVYLMVPLRALRKRGLFEIGGTTGLWPDTVGSLVAKTVHDDRWLNAHSWLLEAWIVAVLVLLPPALWSMRRLDWRGYVALATIAAMMLIVAAASWAQHKLLGVALLEGRRGIFLIPLFVLCALALGRILRSGPRGLAAACLVVGVVAPAALALHNLRSVNRDSVLDWRYDAATRDAMHDVGAWIAQRRPEAPVRMRVNWIFAPSANFYRRTLALESTLLPLDRDGLDGPAELYYGQEHDRPTVVRQGGRPLAAYAVSGTTLFERVD